MSMASPMNTPEIIRAITPLIEAFERIGIPYYIGGSVASSLHGKRRATQDVDIVADLQRTQVQTLVELLENEYYIDADMIQDAIRHQSSFNVLHDETGVKVDVFVLKSNALAQHELRRAREGVIEPGSRPFYFATPEDVILNKLSWWKMGGGISVRQWDDIIEVIRHQVRTLDIRYLRQSASLVGVVDSLEQAFADAGIKIT